MKVPAPLLIPAASRDEPPIVTILMSLILGSMTAGFILWDRRYRRVWQQYRAEKWSQSDGHFSSGEVIMMKTARTKRVAGFEVWMHYQYNAGKGKTMTGIYRRPLSTREAAEAYVNRLAQQRIPVRRSDATPSDSCVLDRC